MRIDPTNINTSMPLPSTELSTKVANKVSVKEGEGAQAMTAFNPTADLSKLLEMVRQVPEVRADVVQDVATRAAVGELASRTAATDTAAAFLHTSFGE